MAKIFADIWHISIFADALLPLGWLEEWLITRLMNKQISVPILRTTLTITMQSNRKINTTNAQCVSRILQSKMNCRTHNLKKCTTDGVILKLHSTIELRIKRFCAIQLLCKRTLSPPAKRASVAERAGPILGNSLQ